MALLLALCLLLAAVAPTSAQLQIPKPRTAAAGDNGFNPASAAANDIDAFCGGNNRALKDIQDPISTLFTGSPANTLLVRFNSPPADNSLARFNVSLLTFRQNGTKPVDGGEPRAVWRLERSRQLQTTDANLRTGNNQYYTIQLKLDEGAQCGQPYSGGNADFSRTHCVLRYVYDSTRSATPQNSRVNCADVVVYSRSSDVSVEVTVRPDHADDAPITPATALRRVLTSGWVGGIPSVDVFQTQDQINEGSGDRTSQQIRMRDSAPVVTHADGTYSMYFTFGATAAVGSQDLANNFLAQGNQQLSLMLGLTVTGSGVSPAGAVAPAAAVTLLLAALVSLLMRQV